MEPLDCRQRPLLNNMGISQNYGYLLGGPHNKDYSMLGSTLGSPCFGKLPHTLAWFNISYMLCTLARGALIVRVPRV